mmetsp:Transcript_4614/g.10882  ORF Transcript_4614/g.10882 Transcript_4614/m.10882 type:complete len:387 (+) Transcript_4614:105-1265(+)|eukprot:s2_g8.t1
MLLLSLLRPSCSASVRHQVRLELIFVCLPLIASVAYCICYFHDDAPERFQYVAFLHLLGAIVLLPLGVLLWWANSLHSAAHYLEDPHSSNALCELFSWVPLVMISPMLVTGSMQDIADTFADLAANMALYVPLLEEPLPLIARYAAYCAVAFARLAHLSVVAADGFISLTPCFARLLFVAMCSGMAVQVRLRYLHKKSTPLTQVCLEERSRTASLPVSFHRQRHQHKQKFTSPWCDRVEGLAGQRCYQVFLRRQLYKAELEGRLFWAMHMHRQAALDAEVLDYVLSFLEEFERPVRANYIGLYQDDSRSTISSLVDAASSSARALSSLSSVTFLHRALTDRWWLDFDPPPLASDSTAEVHSPWRALKQVAAWMGLSGLYLPRPARD